MDDNVEGRVRTVLAEVFELEPEEVGPHTSTDTVEKWDSLQHLTLVLALEEEFAIQFDDEETVALLTYPLITAIVRERVNGAGRI